MNSNVLKFSSARMGIGVFFLSLFFLKASAHGETPEPRVSKTPLVFNKGGTAENPLVYDGKGMTIDLGADVTAHDWIKEGDIWTSRGSLAGSKPISPGQNTALFVDEIPITLAKKGSEYLPAAELKPGTMGVLPDGSFYFRWPTGKVPGQSKIFSLPKAGASCVSIAASYVTVKNVTATHANNDGFNIHGNLVGIRLENIKAISNGDEGISAHETVEMTVDHAEIAWNGSWDGGVADVGQSKTSYTNCISHDNVGIGAFKFFGVEHHISDSLIYNQPKDFYLGPKTVFTQERVTHSATPASAPAP